MKDSNYVVFSNVGPWGSNSLGLIGSFESGTAPADLERSMKLFAEGQLEDLGINPAPVVSHVSCDPSAFSELYDKAGISPCYTRGTEGCWCTVDLPHSADMVFVAVTVAPVGRKTTTDGGVAVTPEISEPEGGRKVLINQSKAQAAVNETVGMVAALVLEFSNDLLGDRPLPTAVWDALALLGHITDTPFGGYVDCNAIIAESSA